MHDAKQDTIDYDAKVAAANAKLAAQADKIAGMAADDPAREVASRLLSLMKTSAATAELNRTLGLFGRDGDS